MTLEPTARPRGTANRILVVVWTLTLLPLTGFLFLISAFAVSPTLCPETGGSYLCRYPSSTAWTLGGIALLLFLGIGLAVAGVAAADRRRSGMFVGASGVAVVGAYLAAMAAGSSWS
ncbi:MAG: hypothetical protein KY451_08020 [Actinobacteria bacterium]|nr:hypothetical protein [Actinomycetota bacterium]